MTDVLILCGGQSPEHEISLRSARNVVGAIDTTKFRIHIIGIDQNGVWRHIDSVPSGDAIVDGIPVKLDFENNCWTSGSEEIACDVVFPVLHGPNGEDGSIQGLLQAMNLPYISPNVLGSSSGMDKEVAKNLLTMAGIKVAAGLCLLNGNEIDAEGIIRELGLPLFVKPANMGSSVGVTKVSSNIELEPAIKHAFQYDNKVLVEKMIQGRELECAVLGLFNEMRVTVPGEIKTEEEYSFDEKYSQDSETQLDIPAKDLSIETIEQLKQTALIACRALNCEILSRVDMFLTNDGQIYVNEVNTIPGFTSISMYPKLWEHEGIPYSDLITELIDQALLRQERILGLKRTRKD